jgi:hypothetical protein
MKKAFASKLPKRAAEDQEAALLAAGIPARDIYVNGRGSESLSACIASFRGRPGELIIAADLRVFGEARKAILDQLALLDRLKITVQDIHNNESSQPIMLDRALTAISAHARFFGSKKTAKITGRRGGYAKGVLQEVKRAERAHKDVVRRLSQCPKLTWEDRAAILGGKPFSASTLRRRYGKQ